MADDNFSTILAYTKSPKVSKRTSFQDELQEAISARAARWKDAKTSKYSDDFEDDDDDILKELLASNKGQKSKEKKKKEVNFFPVSDDESEKPKKVSFLKSSRRNDAKVSGGDDDDDDAAADPETTVSSETKLGRSQRNGQWHTSAFLKSDMRGNREEKIMGEAEVQPAPKPRPRGTLSPDAKSFSSIVDEHPKPRPRQRSLLKKSSNEEEENVVKEDGRTSSSRSPSLYSRSLSTTEISGRPSFSERTDSESPSPEGSRSTSPMTKTLSSRHRRALSLALDDRLANSIESKSREGSPTRDQKHLFSGSSTDGKKSSTLMQLMMAAGNESPIQTVTSTTDHYNEKHPSSVSLKPTQQERHQIIDRMIKEMSQENTFRYKNEIEEKNMKNQEMSSNTGKSTENQPLSSRTQTLKKSSTGRSPRPNTAQSRYLGTLKILDTKPSQDTTSNLEAADTIRVSIYQDWLQKKKLMLEEQLKEKQQKEQMEKEKKVKEEINKKEEAVASFEAWKTTKKKALKAAQEKRKEEEMQKEREAREKEEMKEFAKKAAFEKWKEGKDQYLQDEFRKKKQTEKEKKKKEEDEIMEKKRESIAAFNSWNEKKEEVLKQKIKEKRQEKQKQEQIKSEKEEREKMALELYEKWLVKKERHEKREKKQRWLKAILQDEPPPPWSPPSKTVPYRK